MRVREVRGLKGGADVKHDAVEEGSDVCADGGGEYADALEGDVAA